MTFARGAGAKVVFGLNLEKRTHDKKCVVVFPPAAVLPFAASAALAPNSSRNCSPPSHASRWNSTQAREFITYSQSKGYEFFGFELGNEDNEEYSGAGEAQDFLILQQLLEEVRAEAQEAGLAARLHARAQQCLGCSAGAAQLIVVDSSATALPGRQQPPRSFGPRSRA